MCYLRLGDIDDHVFYTADTVDGGTALVLDMLSGIESRLDDIESNTSDL